MSPDALTQSINTEHLKGGAIRNRPGRCVQFEVASQNPLTCAPVIIKQLTDDNGGFVEGETYYCRATYTTAAGETDDLHSLDPDDPGPVPLEWTVSAGRNSASIAVPIHMRDMEIAEVGENAGGFITIRLTQLDTDIGITTPPDICDPDIYIGWLVYPRSPRLTDETTLGTNCGADDPLYHRTEPWATVEFYDQTTRTFTLSKKVGDVGDTGFIDRDRVDIMMPDRAGFPILSYNVYTSSNNEDFYYAGTGTDGSVPVIIYGVDESAALAPSTRVDRSAPTLVVADVREAVPGQCGEQLVDSNLEAGIYEVRTTWTCGDLGVMGDPGFEERCEQLDMALDQPPLRAEQETWPSNAAYASILDNQGITVTPADGPEINSGWNLYARQLRPNRILTFEGSERAVGQLYSPRSFAYSVALYRVNHNYGTSSLAPLYVAEPPEQAVGLVGLADEFYDTSVIISGTLDPFDPATRGYEPGYPDVIETLDADGDPYFSFASSRDDAPSNEHIYWWHLDSVIDADDIALTTYGVLRVTLRVRPGKTSAATSSGGALYRYVAGSGGNVAVQVWDEQAQAWTVIRDEIGLTDGFITMGFPFAWDESMMIIGRDGLNNPTTARFMILDLSAFGTGCVGFDVSRVELELYRTPMDGDSDPLPDEDCVLQRGGIEPIPDDTYTLKNPLAYRTYLTDGTDPGVGEWESIRPDNTAQWPLVAFGLPLVGKTAQGQETKVNFVGAADSCFRDNGDGSLIRFFQSEGLYWNGVMRHDWRFENYLQRIFCLNEGDPRWNYRFDGLATYPMGLTKPFSDISLSDLDSGTGTTSGEIPLQELFGDRCSGDETLYAGYITDVSQTDALEGTEVDGEIVIGFEVEYYIVYKRTDLATGRSYVVRSEPAQFTKTRRVRGTDSFPVRLTIEGWLCPEPQVTHIEIYRNRFATADYYLVSDLIISQDEIIPDYSTEGIPITDSIIDPPTGRVHLFFDDEIAVDDSDLTLPIEFKTGRPKAAVMMKFNRGRIFYAPQDEREILCFTNITSPSGGINPEGWYVKHQIDPPVRESSAITCISVYHDIVVVSCNTGMVGVQGISDNDNSPDALSASTLATDGGWMGPDAWVNVDNIQYGMTRQGPGWLAGEELNFVGAPIEGTLLDMALEANALFDARCLHYRTAGRTQVWFTFKTNPSGPQQKCLVFDEGVNRSLDREQFWKEWHQMPVHGLTVARDSSGAEYPLMGGFLGRAYRHGSNASDAGLLIQPDLSTRPFESGAAVAFRPRWAYFYTMGEPEDLIMLDLRPDFTEVAINPLPIRIRMGGDVGLTWAQAVSGEPDDFWGGEGKRPVTVERIGMGGTFNQLQYRLYMNWDVWPAGKSRFNQFETTGFNPFDSDLGPRPAKADAGARR